MTLSNIAIVFGPTLGIPINLFVLILSEFEAVFCWTTLKESEEDEDIMSILFSGPEDYLNVSSVRKAQKETQNKMKAAKKAEIPPTTYNDSVKYKSSNNINGKNKEEDENEDDDSDNSCDSNVGLPNINNLITGSIKLRGTKSNLNLHKEKTSKENIDVIKEEEVNTRESLSLGTEIEKIIEEKCRNLDNEDEDQFETMISKEPSSESYRRNRQQRCSSLFVSTPSQIEYIKSLRRLSYGEKGGTIKVFNRNSQEYMDGVPDNFRLSEMFAKEIKSK